MSFYFILPLSTFFLDPLFPTTVPGVCISSLILLPTPPHSQFEFLPRSVSSASIFLPFHLHLSFYLIPLSLHWFIFPCPIPDYFQSYLIPYFLQPDSSCFPSIPPSPCSTSTYSSFQPWFSFQQSLYQLIPSFFIDPLFFDPYIPSPIPLLTLYNDNHICFPPWYCTCSPYSPSASFCHCFIYFFQKKQT